MACGTTIFGPGAQYIKISGGDFVAIQGANVIEKLITKDLQIPFTQIMKSKVTLKAGQTNYLLNNSGLGDNATFLLIRATYDTGSVIEEDNYIQYSYYDDLTKPYYMAQLLLLTGNSTNRVKQLYITNPNPDYGVILDVMAAVIDDETSEFTDVTNQNGTSFVNLQYTSIQSYVVGQSIVVYDNNTPPLPLIYMQLNNINSLQKSGDIIIINDSSLGKIFLQFVTEDDAYQSLSLLNYVLENPNINIANLNPPNDITPPTIYFWNTVNNDPLNDYISFNGLTAGPYDTSFGYTFSTTISLTQSGTQSIDSSILNSMLVNNVIDNRDGLISLLPINTIIQGYTSSGTSSSYGPTISNIVEPGQYGVFFNLSDIANNYVDGVIVNINVI